MIHALPYRRMLILTEGLLGTFSSKTGTSMLRYRREDIVGVLDSVSAGTDIQASCPGIRDVPIFADLAEAEPLRPDAVLIGVAPVGGELPPAMRRHLVEALRRGLSIVSGLHQPLGADPELADLARMHGGLIHDVRQPGPIDRVARGLARRTRARRVLTVGTDCAVGKMLTALELRRAAVAAGLDAAFVATGQTGIMIEGWGLAIDHVLADFVAGAVERLVEHVADRQIMFIEGQGSIGHPGYSGVTLSLLHGCCPDAMVMVHHVGRQCHSKWEDCPLAPLPVQIELYERVLAPLHPGKVVAVAVNTVGMPEDQAAAAVSAIAAETGLPAADPVRQGAELLLTAVRRRLGL